jgi:4-hydroxybenzoyl-CoA thioesterase
MVMLSNRLSLTIERGHCDPTGTVFYPNYFDFFDAATSALFAAAGLAQPRERKQRDVVGMPVVEVNASVLEPPAQGDEVVIESCVGACRDGRLEVLHRLYNDGRLVVEGREVRLWAARLQSGYGGLEAQPIPSAVLEKLA